MSQGENQLWALLVGLAVFGLVVGLVFLRRQARERAAGGSSLHATDDLGKPLENSVSIIPPDGPPRANAVPRPVDAPTARRRPASPPPTGSPSELASAMRSSILRSVAERVPGGWSALVLCPPANPEQMTWHVHLAPAVALDLRDGRTVTVAAPLASHEWHLAGGRVVGLGEGDPEPAPGEDTLSLRVTGPYLVIAVSGGGERGPELTGRVMLASGDEMPQQRALASDVRAAQAALREAVEQAVGSRMLGTPPAVGYRRASWAGHERVWLSVSG